MKRSPELCWYCSNGVMELTGAFYTCPRCGATWNRINKPGDPGIITPAPVYDEWGNITRLAGTPSNRALKEAEEARRAAAAARLETRTEPQASGDNGQGKRPKKKRPAPPGTGQSVK